MIVLERLKLACNQATPSSYLQVPWTLKVMLQKSRKNVAELACHKGTWDVIGIELLTDLHADMALLTQ